MQNQQAPAAFLIRHRDASGSSITAIALRHSIYGLGLRPQEVPLGFTP